MKRDEVDLIVEQWGAECPELEASSLHVLSRVFRLSKKWQRQAAELLKEFELVYWEFDVLVALLRHGPPYALPSAELSRVCLSSLGAMTNRIDGLASRELVERKADSTDRRKVVIALTRKGKTLASASIAKRFEEGQENLEQLSSSERLILEKLLRKLM